MSVKKKLQHMTNLGVVGTTAMQSKSISKRKEKKCERSSEKRQNKTAGNQNKPKRCALPRHQSEENKKKMDFFYKCVFFLVYTTRI